MAKVRKVDYFVMHTATRPGEGARLLKALKKHDVDLLALTAFPDGDGVQVDFVPDDTQAFLKAAKALDWKVSARKVGFLAQGRNKSGALVALMAKLGKAGINITAIDAVASGKNRYGALFWVPPSDVAAAARVLKAK